MSWRRDQTGPTVMGAGHLPRGAPMRVEVDVEVAPGPEPTRVEFRPAEPMVALRLEVDPRDGERLRVVSVTFHRGRSRFGLCSMATPERPLVLCVVSTGDGPARMRARVDGPAPGRGILFEV